MSRKEYLIVITLAGIQFCHILDFVVMMPLGPILIRSLKISPSHFAALVSSYTLCAAVSGILYGVIADKFERKRLLIILFFGFYLATVGCGISYTFESLLIARGLAGSFGGVLTGVVYAIVSDLIEFEKRGTAMGIIMGSFSIASVVGIPTGLAISEFFGWQTCFLFIALLSLPLFIIVAKVLPQIAPPDETLNFKAELSRYGKILLNFEYLQSFGFVFLITLSAFIIIPFLAPFAVSNMNIDESNIKYAYLFGGALTVMTSQLIGRLSDAYGPLRLFLVVAALSTVPMYLYTHSGPVSVMNYVFLGCIFMATISGRFVPAVTMVTKVPKPEDRGTFMALLNSIRSLGAAVATYIAGLIIIEGPSGLLHYDRAGLTSIGLTLVTLLYASYLWRAIKKNEVQSSAQAARN